MMSEVEKPVDDDGTAKGASGASEGDGGNTNAWAAPIYEPHAITAGGGRAVKVVETNGVAQAEQSGKVATDAHEAEQGHPGSG